MTKTVTPPKRITEEEQDQDNPLRGLFEVTKTKTVNLRWEKLVIKEAKEPNEDGEYKQQSWSVRTESGAELGTIYYCADHFKFYHLGLKQPGFDGKDKSDRMGLSKDMPTTIKKMLKNLWGDQYKKATQQD